MNFKVDEIYEGFKLIEQKYVKEEECMARIFEHVKTGAQLLSLENKDPNKVFCITFKTIPEDDSGIAHILEHSVLHGSKRYNIKSPFDELRRCSLYTYTNAMTYPDETMYPLGTMNEQELHNMMRVYLDAVFYPNIYSEPNIFLQEGWRYEIDENNNLTYNGVVFNEMKGATSKDHFLINEQMKNLFPDTHYRFISGGNPEKIIELNLEKLLNFHKEYYHPSNSYIYLYGNGDILKQLQIINEEYLINFEGKKYKYKSFKQKPFSKPKKAEYEFLSESDDENNVMINISWALSTGWNREKSMAFCLLQRILIISTNALLREFIKDKKIGTNIYSYVITAIIQPTFDITIENCDLHKCDEIKEVVLEKLKQIVTEGIDKQLIKAQLHSIKYDMKVLNAQAGIGFCPFIMNRWVYGENPINYLEYEEILNKIEKLSEERYFENLIQEEILNNQHSLFLVGKPNKDLIIKDQQVLEHKLKKSKENLNENELDKLKQANKKFIKYQKEEDDEEKLKCIPKISINDVPLPKEDQLLIEEDFENIKLLYYPDNTKGVTYLDLYFDTDIIEQDELQYLQLFNRLVSNKIDTKNYTYNQLTNKMGQTTGGITNDTMIFTDYKNKDIYYTKFKIGFKAITNEINNAINLINEIMNNTVFSNYNYIYGKLNEHKQYYKNWINDSGYSIALHYLKQSFLGQYRYSNHVDRIEFIKFNNRLVDIYEKENIAIILEKIMKKIWNKNKLIVAITGDKEGYEECKKNLHIILDTMSKEKYSKPDYIFKPDNLNKGFIIPTEVNYVAKGQRYKNFGYKIDPTYVVSNGILNNILVKEIREKGGAYGCYSNRASDNLSFVSYRDPNIEKTLQVYDTIGEYVKNLNLTQNQLDEYKLCAMKGFIYPETPTEKANYLIESYIVGLTPEEEQKRREQIFEITLQGVKQFGEMIETIMKNGNYCVVGNEQSIRENAHLFDEIIDIHKEINS